MTSLRTITSHATCKPPGQVGWGPKPTCHRTKLMCIYIAALREVSVCSAWKGALLLVVSLPDIQIPEERKSILISLCNPCIVSTSSFISSIMFEWICATHQLLELGCPLALPGLHRSQFYSAEAPAMLFLMPSPCLSSVEPSGFPLSSYPFIQGFLY